MFTLCN